MTILLAHYTLTARLPLPRTAEVRDSTECVGTWYQADNGKPQKILPFLHGTKKKRNYVANKCGIWHTLHTGNNEEKFLRLPGWKVWRNNWQLETYKN